MKIFITGCARTGTTLVKNLFYAFDGARVINAELYVDEFVDIPDRRLIVAKRMMRTVFSCELTREDIEKQMRMIVDNDIKVVNCTRNRDDVLKTGRGVDVPAARYDDAMRQAELYGGIVTQAVSYEALVAEPDEVQDRMAIVFGLKPLCRWSDYPDFVPDLAFDNIDIERFVGYGPRPIGREG